MTKNEALREVEKLKGVPMIYSGKLWKLKSYTVDDQLGRIYMETEQGKTIDRPYDGIDAFLKQLEPLGETKQEQHPISMKEIIKQETTPTDISKLQSDPPKTLNDLRDILMNNIENLRTGKLKIDAAKEICNHAQAIVNITKLEMEFYKQKR